jgi:hypothetical protein
MNADRHLLFGLLALQNGFVDKKQLMTAFGIWTANPKQSIDGILVDQKALGRRIENSGGRGERAVGHAKSVDAEES